MKMDFAGLNEAGAMEVTQNACQEDEIMKKSWIRILRDNKDIYDRLETKTKRIADSVRKCGAGRVSVNQIGS